MQLKIKQITFEAAHYIPNHEGRCKGIHGHTYIVENLRITIPTGDPEMGFKLDDKGMSIDFGTIKNYFRSEWDHKFLVPTQYAERMKMYLFSTAAENDMGMIDNIKPVWGTTVEAMAYIIREALEDIVYDKYPNLREVMTRNGIHPVGFDIYEGMTQGASV